MGWIKTNLPDDLHGKLKDYRDRHDHKNLKAAVKTCIVKELNRDEAEHGKLDTTNDREYPTWD